MWCIGSGDWFRLLSRFKRQPVLFQWPIILSFQEEEKSCVAPTVSCLLGDAAASLGQLPAPLSEDVEALERLRHQLQTEWKLLQTTGEITRTET